MDQNCCKTLGITGEIFNFRNKEDEIIIGNWEKRKLKTKKFSKITWADEPVASVQSMWGEPEQVK